MRIVETWTLKQAFQRLHNKWRYEFNAFGRKTYLGHHQGHRHPCPRRRKFHHRVYSDHRRQGAHVSTPPTCAAGFPWRPSWHSFLQWHCCARTTPYIAHCGSENRKKRSGSRVIQYERTQRWRKRKILQETINREVAHSQRKIHPLRSPSSITSELTNLGKTIPAVKTEASGVPCSTPESNNARCTEGMCILNTASHIYNTEKFTRQFRVHWKTRNSIQGEKNFWHYPISENNKDHTKENSEPSEAHAQSAKILSEIFLQQNTLKRKATS